MIDKIKAAIRSEQVLIAEYEKSGKRIQAVEEFENLNILVKLRETYKAAFDRGLI